MRNKFKVRVQMLAALVVFGSALMVVGAFASNAAAAVDNSNNAIMKGGFSSNQNFVTKANANAPGDLKTIYNQYGLAPSQYSKFVSSAKDGIAYRDGRIVVDGQVVGHATQSIGRQQVTGNTQKVSIAGNTYYGGPNSATFSQDSLPVSVLFDSKGVMQFAVLQNCGNPETITPVTPQYSCDQLTKTAVHGKANTYSFTTKATATKNATFAKAVYNFGDGSTQTVTNPSTAVQHTFSRDETVKVTVYVDVPGSTTPVTATSVNCETQVSYTPPVQPPTPPAPTPQTATCTSLTAELTDASTNTYRFTAQANYGGGTKFTSADFDFGDGVTLTSILPAGSTAMISHSYSQVNGQAASAVLHFTNPDGSVQDANCSAVLPTPAPAVQYCKPNIPVGSAECVTDTTQPVASTQLVNTGTSETAVISIFATIVVIGSGVHYFLRRRLAQN